MKQPKPFTKQMKAIRDAWRATWLGKVCPSPVHDSMQKLIAAWRKGWLGK